MKFEDFLINNSKKMFVGRLNYLSIFSYLMKTVMCENFSTIFKVTYHCFSLFPSKITFF